MPGLINLLNIPYIARKGEAKARRAYVSRAAALEAAAVEIVLAPGCHNKPDAPTVGWVLTRQAGEVLAARETRMPDGSTHRRLRVA